MVNDGNIIGGLSADREQFITTNQDRVFNLNEFIQIYRQKFPHFAVNIRLHWQQIMALGFKKIINIGCWDNAVNFKYPHVNYDIVDVKERFNLENFVKGSLYNIPFDDKYFDCAVMGDVLEHLIDPVRAIKEMRRVTSGRLVLTVPSKEHDDLYAWTEHKEKFRQNFINVLVNECKMDKNELADKNRFELAKMIKEKVNYDTNIGFDHIHQFTFKDMKELFPTAEIFYTIAPLWCGFLIVEELN